MDKPLVSILTDPYRAQHFILEAVAHYSSEYFEDIEVES